LRGEQCDVRGVGGLEVATHGSDSAASEAGLPAARPRGANPGMVRERSPHVVEYNQAVNYFKTAVRDI